MRDTRRIVAAGAYTDRVKTRLCAAALVLALGAASAFGADAGRGFEGGVSLSALHFGEFDATDLGAGLRGGYRFGKTFALDAELEYFPSELGRVPFSASRTAAQLRGRAGVVSGRWGVFAALAPGVVHFGAAPEPIACIAVFPPPLECQLAAGRSVPALGLGAGLELFASERLVVRLEVEDRLLRYPVAFRREHRVQHHFRAALGVGLRFRRDAS